jgi:hypothetical protein
MINKNLLRKLDLSKLKKLAEKNKDINHLKTLQQISYTSPKLYHKKKIKEYDEKKKKEEYQNLSQENVFLKKRYNKIKQFFPLKIEYSYSKLINEYNKKGYKTPDFSPERNLFKLNPLLMENNKIKDYYMIYGKKNQICNYIYSSIKDKHLNFLEKEEKIVKDKLFEYSDEKYKRKKTDIYKPKEKLNKTQKLFCSNFSKLFNKSKIKIKLEEENQKIKEYNQKIEKIIPRLSIRRATFTPKLQKNTSKINKKIINFGSINSEDTSFTTPTRSSERKKTNIGDKKYKMFIKCDSIFLNYQNNKSNILKRKSIMNKFKNYSTITNSEREKDKFFKELQKIDLKQLNTKDLELIVQNYCKKFLKFSDTKYNDLMKPKYSDKDLIKLIENLILILDNSEIKNQIYCNNNSNGKITELNNKIYNLQKQFENYVCNKIYK